jgi:hypothetical protein
MPQAHSFNSWVITLRCSGNLLASKTLVEIRADGGLAVPADADGQPVPAPLLKFPADASDLGGLVAALVCVAIGAEYLEIGWVVVGGEAPRHDVVYLGVPVQ